jgi:hypothetical protein
VGSRRWLGAHALVVLALLIGLVSPSPAFAVLTTFINEPFTGVTPPALPANWTGAPRDPNAHWFISTAHQVSGTRSAHAGLPSFPVDIRLVTKSFSTVGCVDFAQVNFQHRYAFDSDDAGDFEYSTDGGTSWTAVTIADVIVPGGTFTDLASAASNPFLGADGWVGTSTGYNPANNVFAPVSINLPAAVSGNANVKVRWRLGTDATSGTGDGWYIDDVQITCTGVGTLLGPENFDASTNLPTGWADDADKTSATYWETRTQSSNTFVRASITAQQFSSDLTTPSIDFSACTNGTQQLTFNHRYSFGVEGAGALFTSTDGTTFTRVPSAAFTAGGYNTANFNDPGHPLDNGPVWTGDSTGVNPAQTIPTDGAPFNGVTVNLPNANGAATYSILWRIGQNGTGGSPTVWDVDDVVVTCDVPAPPEIDVNETGFGNVQDDVSNVPYGTTNLGTPVSKTFTITNSGGTPLTLSNLAVTGTGFSIQTGFSSTNVAPAATSTFTIRMDATTAGNPAAVVSFDNNDTSENPFGFMVSGTVLSPGSPTGTGAAVPGVVLPGASTLLTVTVTPGINPTSTGLAVTVDLSAIGGSVAQAFNDTGTNGDASPGDNIFSFMATVGAGVAPGQKVLPATITDAQGRTAVTTIALTVTPNPAPPSGGVTQGTGTQGTGNQGTGNQGSSGGPGSTFIVCETVLTQPAPKGRAWSRSQIRPSAHRGPGSSSAICSRTARPS